MSVIHAPKAPEFDARQAGLMAVLVIALLVFLLRLWYVQVVRGEELARRAAILRSTSISRLAPRGLVLDRHGAILAGVRPALVLTAVPSAVQSNPWVLDKLARMLGVEPERLEEKVRESAFRPHLPAAIYVGLPIELASKIAESGQYLPGIGVESQPLRTYADSVSLAHVLGYVRAPSASDLERLKAQGIEAAEYVGKEGLERTHERELMGTPGMETLEIDSKRRPIRLVRKDNPIPGMRLQLGLDLELQKLALALLGARRGAVVALEPATGEVLCLASSPSFDTEDFIDGISRDEWDALMSNKNKPLLNRAISSRYAPGSTFKIVTSLAAWKAGFFGPDVVGTCRGYFQLGNKRWKCLGVHGRIRYTDALARSCNAFFAEWAHRAGIENMRWAATACGLGKVTGIDLPAESPGLIPTQEWLDNLKSERKWYPGDTVNMGIGQGETALTPLQLAVLMSLVANRGVAYVPHLVHSVARPGDAGHAAVVPPRVLARVEADAGFWTALQEAMTAVVERGTASGSARIPGLVWAGKTGSAEHVKRELTHSWFGGFAPLTSPKIAVAVLVESAGHGSDVAAPIARQIVEAYLRREANAERAAANSSAASSAADARSVAASR